MPLGQFVSILISRAFFLPGHPDIRFRHRSPIKQQRLSGLYPSRLSLKIQPVCYGSNFRALFVGSLTLRHGRQRENLWDFRDIINKSVYR